MAASADALAASSDALAVPSDALAPAADALERKRRIRRVGLRDGLRRDVPDDRLPDDPRTRDRRDVPDDRLLDDPRTRDRRKRRDDTLLRTRDIVVFYHLKKINIG
tara:strand:+ start:218 stop:535 length:318 start_codon:yes stop_codon:yes gene_type:complete